MTLGHVWSASVLRIIIIKARVCEVRHSLPRSLTQSVSCSDVMESRMPQNGLHKCRIAADKIRMILRITLGFSGSLTFVIF